MGSRQFYAPHRQPAHGKRCKECSVATTCEFYIDVTQGDLNTLYTQHEQYDGYFRDQCVFSDDTDIQDTMSVLVRYENRVQLNYSLIAAAPFEGWKVAFNGSLGRLEAFEPECVIVNENTLTLSDRQSSRVHLDWEQMYTVSDCDGLNARDKEIQSYIIRHYPLFGGVRTHTVPASHEQHGGADHLMRDILFSGTDKEGMATGSRAGAMACLIGIAANVSMIENRSINIEKLLQYSGEM